MDGFDFKNIGASEKYFEIKIFAWLLASLAPILSWCYMPKTWLSAGIYTLFGLLASSWGAIIASLIKKSLEKPFNGLKNDSRLMHLPRYDSYAVSVRLGYVLSKLISELSLFFLALYAAYFMVKIFY